MLKFGHIPKSKTKLAVKTKINAKDKTKALSETGHNPSNPVLDQDDQNVSK